MSLLQTIISPVFYRLVYMSLTALAAGAAVLLIRRLADKRFSPIWKYTMWLLVLAALMIPWRPQSRAAVLSPAEAVLEVSFREDYNQAEAAYSAILSKPQAPAQDIAAAKEEAASLRRKTLAFDELLPLLWFCGAAGTAAFMVIGAFRLRRGIRRGKIDCDMARYEALLTQCRAQLGMRRPVRIIVQSHVRTPALLGLLHPVILLPGYAAEMSDERLCYVILHELSHLRRGDSFVNALLLGLRALYWFNPLLWLLFRFVREDMELANDAAVLRGMEQEAQKEYSLSLVEVLAGCGKQKNIVLCMADSKKNIERRISMIQLGDFFKRRKWVIAATGLLVIASVAALFLTTGLKPKPSKEQDTLMTSLGYTQEMLESIQKNKTPYVGENAKVGAIIYQLPITWKGLAYDSFALQTKQVPYGLTINYKETAENSISDYQENPFSQAMEENNALLLFAAIENLGEVTFDHPADMRDPHFTRAEISAIFGGVPSIGDLDAVYDELKQNLKMDEFYWSHAGRLYLLEATPEDVIYRNGDPESVFTNASGLSVYQYHHEESHTDAEGVTTIIEDYMMYYYFKGSELHATRIDNNSDGDEVDIISWFGQPAIEKNIDGQKYVAYLLRKNTSDDLDKYAWFVFNGGKVAASGLMVGDDFALLNIENSPELSNPYPLPEMVQGDRLFVLEKATMKDKLERMAYVLLRADGTAALGTPSISSYLAPDCTWSIMDGELLLYAIAETEFDEDFYGVTNREIIARFAVVDGGKTLVLRDASVALLAEKGSRYTEATDLESTNTAETSIPTQTQRGTGTSVPPPSATRPDLALNREVEQDGLVLRVTSGYQYNLVGEPFTLTASVTNNTKQDITYLAGESPSIQVNIPGKNGGAFVDMDVWGKLVLLTARLETLKAGETFTETFRILPGKPLGSVKEELSGLEIDWFPAGEYKGTASFSYFTSAEATGNRKQLQVEFPIMLV